MPSPAGLTPDSAGADSGLYSRDAGGNNDGPTQGGSGQSGTSQRSANAREDNAGSSTVLSANQIIVILHDKPEVIVDVKHVMADYFLKQGIAVQEDSITDEMLFSNIATNAELRQTISVWLRARGYALDSDFERSADPAAFPWFKGQN